jgi:hypothetical protein
VGVLVVAAVVAFAVVTLLEGGDDGDDQADTSSSAPAVATTSVGGSEEDIPDRPEEALQAAPALRIHPQRALAGIPLQLEVKGIGCPGSSGVLSITEVGTAPELAAADRLVVRRSFAVEGDRSFHAEPLLVGQPPGTYRVSIECERHRRTGTAAAGTSRDVFDLTELLELTGPLGAREFSVSPAMVSPGLMTDVRYSGEECHGPDARVELEIFSPSALTPGPVTVLRPVVSGGRWSGTHTVAADAAHGTYTFEATCFAGGAEQFTYVARHVRFADPEEDEPFRFDLDLGFLGDDEDTDVAVGASDAPPARPIDPRPSSAADQAVPGTPRYTG